MNTFLKPRTYHNKYPLATTRILQTHSKFEKILGCSCSFIIEKASFIEWLAATGNEN